VQTLGVGQCLDKKENLVIPFSMPVFLCKCLLKSILVFVLMIDYIKQK
jgi:hypothetical protein